MRAARRSRCQRAVLPALPLLVLVLGLVVTACVDDRAARGVGPSTCRGTECGSGPGSGLGTGDGEGGASGDGGVQAVTVSSTVAVTTDPSFNVLTAYLGEATIFAPAPGGGTISAPYGGMSGTAVTLAGVQSGLAWLLVKDATSGAAGVLSTYSPALLAPGATLPLPIVDRSILESVAMTLGTFVDPFAAQVILKIERDGSPLPGIAVASAGGGFVAYDDGPGVYSDIGAETGSDGTILIFNGVSGGASGTLALSLTDGVNTYTLAPIPILAGAATLGQFSL